MILLAYMLTTLQGVVASVSANSTEVGIKKANLPMGELIIVVTTKRGESYASKILNK